MIRTAYALVILALLWPINLMMSLAGLVAVPLALLFTPRDADRLPSWAWPWDNDEDSINGDGQWNRRYPGGRTRRFWPRFVWLALRNRVHNWRRYVTGCGPRTASNFRRLPPRST